MASDAEIATELFEKAAGGGEESILLQPGVEGLYILFQGANERIHADMCTRDALTKVFDEHSWDYNRSFNRKDFGVLVASVLDGAEPSPASTVAGDGEVEADISALVDKIDARSTSMNWRLVDPNDLAGASAQKHAEETISMAGKLEYAELKSFIEHEWEKYEVDNPGDEYYPLAVKRARWVRETYYPLCRQFLLKKAMKTKVFPHRFEAGVFIPVIAETRAEDEELQENNRGLRAQMTPALLPLFEQALWQAWRDVEVVSTYSPKPADDFFSDFVTGKYFVIMAEVLEQHGQPQPSYAFDEPVSGHGTEVTRRLSWEKITKEDISVIRKRLEMRWKDFRMRLPGAMQDVVATTASEEFCKDNYWSVVDEVVREKTSRVPAVDFDCGASKEEAEKRKADWEQLNEEEHVQAIKAVEKIVEEKWNNMLLGFPQGMLSSMKKDAYNNFMKDNYWASFNAVLMERSKTGELRNSIVTTTHEQPLQERSPSIPFHSGASEEEAKRRSVAWRRLSSYEQMQIDGLVEDSYAAMLKGMGPAHAKHLPEKPPSSYWVGTYFEHVMRLAAEKGKHTARSGEGLTSEPSAPAQQPHAGAAQGSDSFSGGSRCAMWRNASFSGSASVSMEQRAKMGGDGMDELLAGGGFREDVSIAAPEELQYVGSLGVMVDAPAGSKWKYEGRILDRDEEPRVRSKSNINSSPQKRKANSTGEDRVAMDLLLADRTGPVNVTLWDDVALKFVDMMRLKGKGAGSSPLVRLVGLRVGDVPKSEWNGPSLTPVRILHSLQDLPGQAGTVLDLPFFPESPFMLSATYTCPPSSHCIKSFGTVRSKLSPPFRCCLQGIVADVQEASLSQNGNLKKQFHLVDEMGYWILCCALGRNVNSTSLEEGNEVVCYAVTGRGGLGTNPGMVYLMKDSVIVKTGRQFLGGVVQRQEIELVTVE